MGHEDQRRRVYGVNAGPLMELDVWLAPYRRLWNGSLDALGRRLDEVGRLEQPENRPEKRKGSDQS